MKNVKRGNEYFNFAGVISDTYVTSGICNEGSLSHNEPLSKFLENARPVAIWQGDDELIKLRELLGLFKIHKKEEESK